MFGCLQPKRLLLTANQYVAVKMLNEVVHTMVKVISTVTSL